MDTLITKNYYRDWDALVIKTNKAINFTKFELKSIRIALIEYYFTKPRFRKLCDESFKYSQDTFSFGTHLTVKRGTHLSNQDEKYPHFNISIWDEFGEEIEAHCYWDITSIYPKIYKITLSTSI